MCSVTTLWLRSSRRYFAARRLTLPFGFLPSSLVAHRSSLAARQEATFCTTRSSLFKMKAPRRCIWLVLVSLYSQLQVAALTDPTWRSTELSSAPAAGGSFLPIRGQGFSQSGASFYCLLKVSSIRFLSLHGSPSVGASSIDNKRCATRMELTEHNRSKLTWSRTICSSVFSQVLPADLLPAYLRLHSAVSLSDISHGAASMAIPCQNSFTSCSSRWVWAHSV